MSDSLSEQAHKKALEQVRAEKPHAFTVGGSFDGKQATGGITYERKWSNGWGLTAYAKAYWHDAPIVPTDQSGYVAGAELTKKF